MKPILKKHIITLLKLIILDILLIGCWTLYFEPDSSMTIALIFIIPAVFIANLIIACVIFFIRRYYTIIFIVNAFIAPIILCFFFDLYIRICGIIYWESWDFCIDKNKYNISYCSSDKEKEFNVTYSYEPGMSISVENGRGVVIERNDTVYFVAVNDSIYFIYKDYLYNFKNHEKIKVKKIN